MSKHTIDELREVSEKEIRQLPDRSYLSSLYFNTKQGYQKGSVNFENASNESSRTQYKKALDKYFALIGLLIPIPFSIAILLFSYFAITITNGFSIMLGFPLIAVSGMILMAITVSIYKKIRTMLEDLGISTPFFLLYMLFCLSLIFVPSYFLVAFINNPILTQIASYLIISVASIAITRLLLIALGDEEIDYRARSIMKIIPIIICLIIAVASNMMINQMI